MKTPFVRKFKITGVIIAGVFLLSIIGFSYLFFTNQSGSNLAVENKIKSNQKETLSGKNIPENNETNRQLSIEDKLVNELKTFYGKTISEKSTQLILLKVKKFLVRLYPKDGDVRFYNILKRAFPDLADEIRMTLEKMEQYHRWVDENTHLLSQMNEIERQGALWKKRGELFGDDAQDIWTDEILEYEKRKQDIRETLSSLDESADKTIYEKLELYKRSLSKTYEDTPESYILQNKDMLAKVFFGIDSVQNELKRLDPEQRRWEINKIRSEMGFTQEQVEKMEKLDAYRERRWENGLAYMKERENVVQEFKGPELEKQLEELRGKYFKHESKTIALEEKDGFFRYNRPRVYGRN